MRINWVKYSNVFYYGNHEQYHNFNEEPMLWQIIGKNGVGKSSLIRIIKIGAYQELDGLLNDEIANEINKNGYIIINITSNTGINYTIHNHFSPNKLFVFKGDNDKPENWGGVADVKKRIRTEISTIPYHVFNNTLSLSINDFKSFLKMTPKDSKEIRDKIFSFSIFNYIYEDFKKENNAKESDRKLVQSEIDVLVGSVASNIERKTSIVNDIIKENESKVLLLKENLSSLEKQISDIDLNIQAKEKSLATYTLVKNILNNRTKTESIAKLTESKNLLSEKVGILLSDKERQAAILDMNVANKAILESRKIRKQIEEQEASILKMENKKASLESKSASITSELEIKNVDLESIKLKLERATHTKSLISHIENIKIHTTNYSQVSKNLKLQIQAKETHTGSLTQATEHLLSIKKDIEQVGLKIKLYESGQCGSCGTNLSNDAGHQELYRLRESLEEMTAKRLSYEKIIEDAKSNIENLDLAINELTLTSTKYREEVSVAISNHDNEYSKCSSVVSEEFSTIRGKQNSDIVSYINKTFADDAVDRDILIDEHNVLEGKRNELVNELNSVNKEINTLTQSLLSTKSFVLSSKKMLSPVDNEINIDENELDNNIATSKHNIELLNNDYRSISSKIEEISREIKLMESAIVPVPDTAVQSFSKNDKFKDLSTDELVSKFNSMFDSVKEEINLLVSNRNQVLKSLEDTKIQISSIGDPKNYENQVSAIEKIIKETQGIIDEKNDKLSKIQDEMLSNSIILYSLSDEGVKSFVLKNIIPSLNYEIAQYMANLYLPLEISFNDSFEVSVIRNGGVANLKSISTGQTKLIDCCILLAITKILKTKYSSVNMVFYDEVFSSLDSDYGVIVLDMFNEICCKGLGIHVFMINHSYLPSSYFGRVISITNDGRFSEATTFTSEEYMLRSR